MASSSTTAPTPGGGEAANTKAEEIRRLLSEPTVDLWKLRELALSEGGLVNDSLRKLAWPKLLGLRPTHYFDGCSSNDGATNTSSSSHGRQDHTNDTSPTSPSSSNSEVPPSLDALQIERDISRVTWHILTGNQRSRNFQMKNKHRKRIAQLLKKKQRRLGDYLNLVLVLSYCTIEEEDGHSTGKGSWCDVGGQSSEEMVGSTEDSNDNDRLRYYQGFHDVASIILSALGGATLPSMSIASTTQQPQDVSTGKPSSSNETETDILSQAQNAAHSSSLTLALQVLLRLSHSHFRDAMRSDFLTLQSALKLILMPLLAAFDPQLHSHLADCEMEPYFCLSWIITWFAHDVRDTALVKRMYDFFIVSHPLMSVYVSVAMMIHPLNRIEVLGADCDFACVHNALADLPKNSSNVGWKYLPGDTGSSGYATGEDDEDNMSYDASLQDQSIDEGDDVSMGMMSVGGSGRRGGSRPRVPFQELIDLSITLMHKIPPRNLLNLANRYHDQITLQPLLAQSSSIALLQPPPSWGLASCADADWVLRQKMREEYVEKAKGKLNRHQRKNRVKDESSSVYGGSGSGSVDPLVAMFDGPSVRALIASGTGPDGLAEMRKLRKKRKMMVRSVAVAMLAIMVAVARSYYLSSRQGVPMGEESKSSPQQRRQQLTMDALKEDSVSDLLLSSLPDDTAGNDDVGETDREATMEKEESKLSPDHDSASTMQEKEVVAEDVKADNNVCANDDEQDVDEVVISEDVDSVVVMKDDVMDQEHQPQVEQSATSSPESVLSTAADERTAQAALLIFVKSMKNLTMMHRNSNNQTLDLHLDQLEQHFDYLMAQLMQLLQIGWHQTRAGWSKIAPVLVNALHIGWHQIRAGWTKIAPIVKKEFMLELDGEPMEWAEDAVRTWKKQEVFLRNHGRFIQSVVKDVRKRTSKKEGRSLKEEES